MPVATRHHRPSIRHRDNEITQLDLARWAGSRAGMSIRELAARENVKLSTVEKSLEKMRLHAARTSQESVEMATRELYIDSLPSALQVFERALHAKKFETKVVTNPDTEKEEIIMVEVEDLDMQLKAVEKLKSLLAGVTPKTPMVAVDARTQINNQGQLAAGSQGQLSSESLIRQIRAQPNFQLTDGQIRTVAQQTAEEIGLQIKQETEQEAADIAEAAEADEAEYVDEG